MKAFYAASDPAQYPDQGPPFQPDKLYYHTFPRGWLSWMVRLMPLFGKDPRRFGQNEDINLLELAGDNFPVHARRNYKSVLKEKEAATACHASQSGMVSSGNRFVRLAFRVAAGQDSYMRAYPAPDGGPKEVDLFAGISVDE